MVESKILLENDRVRVVEHRVAPGERMPMHTHGAYVVYPLNSAKVRISFPDGSSKEQEIEKGRASYSAGITHAIENIGSAEFHNVDIELKD
jgi:beta-alanine degradation protein BauB